MKDYLYEILSRNNDEEEFLTHVQMAIENIVNVIAPEFPTLQFPVELPGSNCQNDQGILPTDQEEQR